jgi:hypothetical protein
VKGIEVTEPLAKMFPEKDGSSLIYAAWRTSFYNANATIRLII